MHASHDPFSLVFKTIKRWLRLMIILVVGIGCLAQNASPPSSAMSLQPAPPDQPNATGSGAANFARIKAKTYSGSDLSGWKVEVGDGIWAAPGEAPVDKKDIDTLHFPPAGYSELRANLLARKVMAHNITYKQVKDADAMMYLYTGVYEFMLPYQPAVSNVGLNGETIEGHMSVWDGADTRLEYIVGFQWIVNPSSPNYGDLNLWDNPGVWKKVGVINPDANWGVWHTVQMRIRIFNSSAGVTIDDTAYPANLVKLTHDNWDNKANATLAAEIISMYPGEGSGTFHYADFRNWSWVWELETVYLPAMMKNY